jgi:hypothetical protein
VKWHQCNVPTMTLTSWCCCALCGRMHCSTVLIVVWFHQSLSCMHDDVCTPWTLTYAATHGFKASCGKGEACLPLLISGAALLWLCGCAGVHIGCGADAAPSLLHLVANATPCKVLLTVSTTCQSSGVFSFTTVWHTTEGTAPAACTAQQHSPMSDQLPPLTIIAMVLITSELCLLTPA